LEQLLGVDRLLDVRAHSHRVGALARGGVGAGADDDHGDPSERGDRLQPLYHREPLAAWEAEVEQDQIRALLAGNAEGGDGVAGEGGVEAVPSELEVEQLADICVVIDDQNLLLHPAGSLANGVSGRGMASISQVVRFRSCMTGPERNLRPLGQVCVPHRPRSSLTPRRKLTLPVTLRRYGR